MTADGLTAVQLRIYGRVQGVCYRAWTVERATAAGLGGWVRNRADGSVEALLAGPAPLVKAMVAACRQGPPAARVSRVDLEPATELPGAGRFVQRPTL